MTARIFGIDPTARSVRRSSAVRSSAETRSNYDLTVLATDVDDVVRAAGGWLCDRVRAGWHVSVLVQAGPDAEAGLGSLTVLGVRACTVDSALEALQRTRTAAVAVAPELVGLTGETAGAGTTCRTELLRRLDDGAEVTVWGEASPPGDVRFAAVCHRLSAAARAFKEHAVRTGTGRIQPVGTQEDFVSAQLWYPTSGADLEPRA